MFRLLQILATTLIVFSCVYAQNNTIRINEFMALNSTVLSDSNGIFSDWIEIYNPTESAVNLLNWSLTDDSTKIDKWKFPEVILPANGYLIVFASDKNISANGYELHTNFKLSGSGEYLGLFDPSENEATVFSPSFPPQKTDVSYGYYDETFLFSTNPTPGTENIFPTTQSTPAPVFNKKHGFYTTSFDVAITSDTSSSKIYYTTNGDTPGELTGILYTQPVSITTTTVLRAIAVNEGMLPSSVMTATYLFLQDVINQPNNPPGYPAKWGPYTVIPDTAIADYEMDPEITQDPKYSGLMEEALLSIPTISIVTDKDNIFSRIPDSLSGGIYIYTGAPDDNEVPELGNDWERPASIEYFDRNGTKEFQVNCGLKLHGGHSRRPEKTPKHSFTIIFREKYGISKLRYPLFDADATDEFNSIVLRATYGNTWLHMNHSERKHTQLIRDLWAKDTHLDMGLPAGHGNYAHLYINGLYWGIYNPTEHIDEDFAETYLGGDKSDYDIIKDYGEVVSGDRIIWNAMFTLARAGLADNTNYQKIQGKNPDGTINPSFPAYLDVENLIDYMIINFYGANWDWDHHNWIAIRNRINPGEGFQFFSWDTEHILENVSSNILSENNSGNPSEVFQLLLENSEFKQLFADRVQKHCFNVGALTPEVAKNRWMKRADEIDTAIVAESARWGDYRRDVHRFNSNGPFYLYDRQFWLDEQSFLVNSYFPNRTATFITQLKDAGMFPNINAPQLFINGIPLTSDVVKAGDTLTMSFDGSTAYYTIDGNDPEIWGEPSSTAVVYTGPIVLPTSTSFKTRVFYRDEWSALVDINVSIASALQQLKITELHYHPLAPDTLDAKDFEFVELKNTGNAIDIGGVKFMSGISYTFPPNTVADSGSFIIIASNKISFASYYGFSPFDEYSGSLDNSGEKLVILSSQSDTLVSMMYDDEFPWPIAADGGGYSLVSVEANPNDNPNDPSYWRLSGMINGSPGSDDLITNVELTTKNYYPKEFRLYQNYPNPFNPATQISYSIPRSSYVTLNVYNLLGQKVETLFEGLKQPGIYKVTFDGSGLASGIYLYQLKADNFLNTKKLLLLK